MVYDYWVYISSKRSIPNNLFHLYLIVLEYVNIIYNNRNGITFLLFYIKSHKLMLSEIYLSDS